MTHEVVSTGIYIPEKGVRLNGGLFLRAFENNIGYLKSLSMDSTLYWFRVKAGQPAPGEPYRGHFEDNIKGQTAGLVLMGAANSLRWQEDSRLREMVEQIVDGISHAVEPDGFFEPIPKSEFGTKEYPNYVRVWLNYGLKAAHRAGSPKALDLMRGMQSWFNQCDERVIAKDLMLGFQGVIANTTVALSEAGLPEDLQTVVDHYQENWWLAQFIRGEEAAVHKRPTPHGTELEAITAYMDMYLATGKPLYLNAVNGAYRMYRNQWQHTGGGIVAIENTEIKPGCLWLDPIHKYNELCCSAHWLYLNQRYHRLYPDEESYASEIEKTLYNIVIANQVGCEHIRYHAYLDIQKDGDRSTPVSCCAGLGTRVLGSLPEFVFSVEPNGLYVDLYTPAEIEWQQGGQQVKAALECSETAGGEIRLMLSLSAPQVFKLHLRIPNWTAPEVTVMVNSEPVVIGKAGSYLVVTRAWKDGDIVSFSLPLLLHSSNYQGLDQAPGGERWAIEYGPLLLGLVGALDYMGRYTHVSQDPRRVNEWLEPIHGKPGHFLTAGKPGYEWLPYYEIGDEIFTCYPVLP